MTIEELREALEYLTRKYVDNPDQQAELLELIKRPGGPPVKGILADLCAWKSRPLDDTDVKKIGEIVYFFV